MTAPDLNKFQLTPEQTRRLGAVYPLTPSWKQENKHQQISQTNLSALIPAPICGFPTNTTIPIIEA